MKAIKLLIFSSLCLSGLYACAAQRKDAVCTEIRMRLNSMDYSASQRVFIQEELDSCESARRALDAEQQNQYKSIYQQFAADSASSGPSQTTVLDSATATEVSPVNP